MKENKAGAHGERDSFMAWPKAASYLQVQAPPAISKRLKLLGRKGLEVLEQRLAAHQWLALDHVTIADIACFPYVAPRIRGAKYDSIPTPACAAGSSASRPCRALVGMPGI